MKKRGFTLIELLAVIVILAIIALVAIPMTLDTIEKSRKGAAMRSIEGYVEAANNKAVLSLINSNDILITKDKYSYETGEDDDELSKIKVKSNKPDYVYLEYDVELKTVVLGNFCQNGYSFDYDNGTITEGVINYCNKTLTDRPRIVVSGPKEMNSKVTMSIEFSENTVAIQYKIGNGEYQEYTEPFEIESTKELASERDEQGNLKVCAKAILHDGETEICRNLIKLDLDFPTEPVISASFEYPLLEISGIATGKFKIQFDKREGITNYVSFNGTDWSEYTGNEQLIGSTIYAKSVKKDSELTSTATENVSTPASDVLPIEGYNGDTTDTMAVGTYYLKIGDSIKNKEFEIFWYDGSSGCATSFAYADANKKVISGTKVELTNIVGNKVNRYTVNSSAEYMVLTVTDSKYCTIREVRPINYPTISSSDYDYPVWSEDGNVIYETVHAEISYHEEATKNLYKLNDSEWIEYKNKVVVPLGSTIYAKSIFADGLSSTVISFEAAPFSDALPMEGYNGDITDQIAPGTYYLKINEEAKNKEFDIYWHDGSSGCETSFAFLDVNKKVISGTKVILGNNAGSKVDRYAINSNAQYITFVAPNSTYCRIKEVRIVNAPIIEAPEYDYPIWSQSGISYKPIKVTINYNSKSVQKLYKIDDGDWMEYNGQFILPLGATVYAKSIFENNFSSLVTTFEAAPFSDVLPAEGYNGDITDQIAPGTYYLKIGDDIRNKEFDIYWHDGSSGCETSFAYTDANKKVISGTKVTLGNNVGSKVNRYTINSDAQYITFIAPNSSYCRIKEVSLVN